MASEASMRPIAECCDVTCQTVTITGVWNWQQTLGNLDFETSFSPSIGLITSLNEVISVSFVAARNTVLNTCNDGFYVDGPYDTVDPFCFWFAENPYISPPGAEAGCIQIATGQTYEMKVSWCESCATPLVMTFGVFGEAVQRTAQLSDVCSVLTGGVTFGVANNGALVQEYCTGIVGVTGAPTSLESFDVTCGAITPGGDAIIWQQECTDVPCAPGVFTLVDDIEVVVPQGIDDASEPSTFTATVPFTVTENGTSVQIEATSSLSCDASEYVTIIEWGVSSITDFSPDIDVGVYSGTAELDMGDYTFFYRLEIGNTAVADLTCTWSVDLTVTALCTSPVQTLEYCVPIPVG